MTAPSPRANPFLAGHTQAQRILRQAACSRRLHHAWLLTGDEGIGKSTLAFRFARALLADFPGPGLQVPPSHPVFGQVAAGTHPDLVTVARAWDEKKQRAKLEIPIEDTRSLLELFAMTPAAGGWRVVVVVGAESLNRNASNALLKLLEEPPDRAVFLLTSALPDRLARTVRSRCACLRLRPLDDPEMSSALADLLPDIGADRLPDLIRAAAGSPGKAVRNAIAADANLSARDPTGSATTFDHLARLQSVIRRALGDRHTAEPRPLAAIERDCEAWSALVRLSAATDQFNLDRQQLLLEAARRAGR